MPGYDDIGYGDLLGGPPQEQAPARPSPYQDPAIAQAIAELAKRRAAREQAIQGSAEAQKWATIAGMANSTLQGMRGAFSQPLTRQEGAENRAALAAAPTHAAEGAASIASAPLQAQLLGQKLEHGDIEALANTEDLKNKIGEHARTAARYDPTAPASAAARGEEHQPLSIAEAEDVGKLRHQTASAAHTEEETGKIQRNKALIGEGTIAKLYANALGISPQEVAQLSLEDMPALDKVLMHKESMEQARQNMMIRIQEARDRREEPDIRTRQSAKDVLDATAQALDVLERSGGKVLGAGTIMGKLEQMRNPDAQKMAAAMATLGRTIMTLRGRGGSSGGGPAQQAAALTEIGYNAPNASDEAVLTNIDRAIDEANRRLERDPQGTARGDELRARLARLRGAAPKKAAPSDTSGGTPGSATPSGPSNDVFRFKIVPKRGGGGE